MAAAQAIAAVLQGQSLSDALTALPGDLRPGAQALSFYAMRELGLAQQVLAALVVRTPGTPQVRALLLLGLCLLEAACRAADGREQAEGTPLYPAHTLVHQIVAASTLQPATRRAKGLVNAVLRRYTRERPALLDELSTAPSVRWNHPDWWIQTLQAAWPNDWQAILQASNQAPPMTLRTNPRRLGRDTLQQRLQDAGLHTRAVGTQGLTLARAQPVHSIPGYAEGWWSVQDVSAQRAGDLLPIQDGMRVLDACAAPGGKTAHLLERCTLDLTALDCDAQRLARVADNLQRLGLQSETVRLHCANAARPADWWDGRPFDAILADVPCTASGVVRRHPDIRWLRRPGDLARTAALQARILDALWPTLAAGGHLLYVTCSLFPQEGRLQAQAFRERHPDAHALPAPGHLLPGGSDQGDGFYYALFAKRT